MHVDVLIGAVNRCPDVDTIVASGRNIWRSITDKRTVAHGQTNHGVSDPAISREGKVRARRAGSLTPWFVRCQDHKPRSRAAHYAARFTGRKPTHRLASQAVIAGFAFANDLESTAFHSREMSLMLRTTSDSEVVPEVVLCCCEIRRRQPGRRDGSTGV